MFLIHAVLSAIAFEERLTEMAGFKKMDIRDADACHMAQVSYYLKYSVNETLPKKLFSPFCTYMYMWDRSVCVCVWGGGGDRHQVLDAVHLMGRQCQRHKQ